MGALLAALVHEFAHCVAIRLCGGQVISLQLGVGGAVIEASPMTPGKEAICALAGPIGSFSLMLIAEHYPEAAVCALIQGIYNLLPFYPQDGGRILRILFSESVCKAVKTSFVVLFAGFGLWMGTLNGEIGIIILAFLLIPLIRGKITCKESKQAVQ